MALEVHGSGSRRWVSILAGLGEGLNKDAAGGLQKLSLAQHLIYYSCIEWAPVGWVVVFAPTDPTAIYKKGLSCARSSF
jgi:hypothetical protein